ncbi:MAG: DNA repair protein RecO [Clostridia bacterium]
MIIKTQGLIIKEQTVGESDRLVTVLTADYGIIKAFATKAKTLKSSKNASTSLLAYSNLSIYKGKDKYIIDSAMPIEIFFDLRNNIESLSLAQYFCELAFLFVPEGKETKEYLRLVLNSMHFLCKNKKNPIMIKFITELRMLTLAGFMPNLVACQGCHCYENELWYFLVRESSVVCAECLEERNYGAMPLNQSMLNAMRHIVFSEFNNIYNFNLSVNYANDLAKIIEAYTLNVLGNCPMTLDFYKTLVG